jgi:Uma2 family endonuclease
MAMRVPRLPEADIPAEAPKAPTEQEWARMTPVQRERAVEALLASDSLEEIEEREAMAEGDPHLDAKMDIRNTLRTHFGRLGRRIYVGADIKVFYPGKKGFTPDVIVVTDVDPGRRDCWMVSQEGKGIDLAFEVHYKGNRRKDFSDNVLFYASLGIQEYFAYDIRRQILRGYRLPERGAEYEPIPPQGTRLPSRVLDLDIALEEGRVRFYVGSAILITDEEVVTRLEHMLETAVTRVEEESALAEQAAARLAEAVVAILTVRGLEVKPGERERILACTDLPTLGRWTSLAMKAASPEELFAEG